MEISILPTFKLVRNIFSLAAVAEFKVQQYEVFPKEYFLCQTESRNSHY